MAADAGAQCAVGGSSGRSGGGVNPATAQLLGAVLGPGVTAQQLPRAEVTRYGDRHWRGAPLQAIPVAVAIVEATRHTTQQRFSPLPVTKKGAL